MSRVIVRRAARPYVGAMRDALARLLLLLTVLVMPFGMTDAAATAAPMVRGGPMDMRHCSDHQTPAGAHHQATSECAMACASALPAAPAAIGDGPPLVAGGRQLPTNSARLDSRAPAIATPPPRLA